jgi:hypothetical protein
VHVSRFSRKYCNGEKGGNLIKISIYWMMVFLEATTNTVYCQKIKLAQ